MTGPGNQPELRTLSYTQAELDAMSKEDLLLLYKSSGCQDLKWPLALRYVGLVKSIALQVRGIYSSFAQVDDIINEGVLARWGLSTSLTQTSASSSRPLSPSGSGGR